MGLDKAAKDESGAEGSTEGSAEGRAAFWKRMSKGALISIVGTIAALMVVAFLSFRYLDRDNILQADAPPKATDKAPSPGETTQISVPVEVDSSGLSAAIEKAIPQTLWSINQEQPRCIPPQHVKVFGKRLAVTPAIKCTIIGQVTRGKTRLRTQGDEILVDVPIRAQISARDVAGILKGETATAAAQFHARIKVDIDRNWQPQGTVRFSYDWTKAPGIDFLGQRITFTDKADEALRPVLANLQGAEQGEFRKINLRKDVDAIWRQAFTNLSVNRENPPVWIRVTPQKVMFGGYSLSANRIRLNVGIEGKTETFVGDEPSKPTPTPLPPLLHGQMANRLNFFLPVKAEYAELEPVLMRALQRRSERPFVIPKVGNVNANFKKVTIYGTPGNRIAVGLDVVVQPENKQFEPMEGMLWLTAFPINDAGSAEVRFKDVTVAGDTSKVGGDLLLQFGNSPVVAEMLASSLTQNFTKDVNDLKGKIHKAVDRRQEGDFLIQTSTDEFDIGVIQAFGDGLYLPVRVKGQAEISYRPD